VDIGVSVGHPQDTVEAVTKWAARAEAAGLARLGVADTQGREAYGNLVACALSTSRIRLGTFVTNPVTRQPGVTAQSIATVDEVAQGRAFLGIGTGNSAPAINGMSRSSASDLEVAIRQIRRALGSPRLVDEGGAAIPFRWTRPDIPVAVHAGGPLTRRVAVRVADAVLLREGDVSDEEFAKNITEMNELRRSSHPEWPLEFWAYGPGLITETPDEIRTSLAGVVSARARTAKLESVPDELREPFAKYISSYDYAFHGSAHEPRNFERLERLGLDEYMITRYARLAGPLGQVAERCRQLAAFGASTIMISGSVVDKDAHIDRLGELAAGLNE
jgi:5,10-methylenetetrahydromethanopterin reductase